MEKKPLSREAVIDRLTELHHRYPDLDALLEEICSGKLRLPAKGKRGRRANSEHLYRVIWQAVRRGEIALNRSRSETFRLLADAEWLVERHVNDSDAPIREGAALTKPDSVKNHFHKAEGRLNANPGLRDTWSQQLEFQLAQLAEGKGLEFTPVMLRQAWEHLSDDEFQERIAGKTRQKRVADQVRAVFQGKI